jgi:hypothetical protein
VRRRRSDDLACRAIRCGGCAQPAGNRHGHSTRTFGIGVPCYRSSQRRVDKTWRPTNGNALLIRVPYATMLPRIRVADGGLRWLPEQFSPGGASGWPITLRQTAGRGVGSPLSTRVSCVSAPRVHQTRCARRGRSSGRSTCRSRA